MAISEFVMALCALMGTLLIPYSVMYQMLRLRRRAVQITCPAAPRGNSR